MTTSQGTHSYTYDDIYQLTQVDYPAGDPFSDKTYNYDPVGNRDSVVNGGTVSYSRNELNEYTNIGGTSYTSDQRGNLTSDGSQSYIYDLDNRLTGIGQSISYTYDPFGKRIEKNVNSSITRYIHDGDQIVEEWEGETLARKYVYGMGIDEPLVMITSGGSKYYYHFDALGSVRNLTDSTGATVASYKYDVYGAFSLTGNAQGNPYTFTGRQWDTESGLYYYRARYYSPTMGRFLQTDPMGYKEGTNLYAYVTNSPVVSGDPTGRGCCIQVESDSVSEEHFVTANHWWCFESRADSKVDEMISQGEDMIYSNPYYQNSCSGNCFGTSQITLVAKIETDLDLSFDCDYNIVVEVTGEIELGIYNE